MMQVFNSIHQMKQWRQMQTAPVALVPTMGYLHEGHLSLIKRAQDLASLCVVSIFVNPTQFTPAEDLHRYPRDFDHDLTLLKKVSVDVLFFPSNEEMYPPGFDTWVTVSQMSEVLEGAARPGHFRGVTTIVAKLLNITRPHFALFGQKDAQQAIILQKMVHDLNVDTQMVVCPTIRLSSGLALSSRNAYLSQNELEAATCIFQSLSAAEELYKRGYTNAETLTGAVKRVISKEKLARLEYVSLASLENFGELKNIEGPSLLSLAVRIGSTRLIDNLILGV